MDRDPNATAPGRDGGDDKDRVAAREDALGRLADAIAARLERAETIPVEALAREFGVAASDVERVKRGLEAVALAGADTGSTAAGRGAGARAPLPAPKLPDDYEVQGELGRGGMGIVYRARQRSLDRAVAVKVLMPGELLFGEAIARFCREARTLARLRHTHIVAVHEVGDAGGRVFYTMDLVEGGTVADLIRRGEVTPARAVRLLRQVASAIAHAHAHGIVHRDLKPGNVLVDAAGDAVVSDFGLARDLGVRGDLTLTGQFIGTPAYMSPEQAAGDTGRIGEATDVYALGAILYECLTGRPPFTGLALPDLIHAVIHRDPARPRRVNAKVPHDLEVICLKAMAKVPGRRYATARALLEDLERFEEGRPIRARPPSLGYRARRFVRRQWVPLATAAIGAAVVGALIFAVVAPRLGASAQALLATAEDLHEAGQHEGAALVLERALSKTRWPERQDPRGPVVRVDDPLTVEVAQALVRCRGEAARDRLLAGRMDAAIAHYERAVELAGVLAREPLRQHGSELGGPPRSLRGLQLELASCRATLDPTHPSTYAFSTDEGMLDLVRAFLDRIGPAVLDPLHAGHASARAALIGLLRLPNYEISRAVHAWFREDVARATAVLEALLAALPRTDRPSSTEHHELERAIEDLAGTNLRPAVLATLERAAEDRRLPEHARAAAVRHLRLVADLPASWPEYQLPGAAQSEEALALWRRIRDRPRAEAHRERVRHAIELGAALRAAATHPDLRGVSPRYFDLLRWVLPRVGLREQAWHQRSWPDQGRLFLATHGAEDPRLWLARGLGLPGVPRPEDLPALALRLFEARRDERARLHHLLSLCVPENAAPPLWRESVDREQPEVDMGWQRLLFTGTPLDRPYVLRVAHLSDPDGEVRWEEAREVRIGQTVEMQWPPIVRPDPRDRIWAMSGDLGTPGFMRPRARRKPEIESVVLRATLERSGRALVLRWVAGERTSQGSCGWTTGGQVAPLGRARGLFAREREIKDIVVATLDPAGSHRGPWAGADWRRRIAAEIAALSVQLAAIEGRGRLKYGYQGTSLSQFFHYSRGGDDRWDAIHLASIVTLPEARGALARLQRPFQPRGAESYTLYAKMDLARVMAGDARGLRDWSFDWWERPAVAARLLVVSEDPRVRDAALAQLGKADPLSPDVGDFLEHARRAGRIDGSTWSGRQGTGAVTLEEKVAASDPLARDLEKNLAHDLRVAGVLLAATLALVVQALWPRRTRRVRLFSAALLVACGVGFIALRLEIEGPGPALDLLFEPAGYAMAAAGAAILARAADPGRRSRWGTGIAFAVAGALDVLARIDPGREPVWRVLAAVATIVAVCTLPTLAGALRPPVPAGDSRSPYRGFRLLLAIYAIPTAALAIIATDPARLDRVLLRFLATTRWGAEMDLLLLTAGLPVAIVLVALLAAAGQAKPAPARQGSPIAGA